MADRVLACQRWERSIAAAPPKRNAAFDLEAHGGGSFKIAQAVRHASIPSKEIK
jgi:hypothetical protein